MRPLIFVLLALPAACGGSSPSSPTTPSPPAPPPQPATWTLSGTLTETLTGAPLAGATLDFSQLETVTADGAGQWTLRRTGTPPASILTEIKAGGFLDRRVYINAGGSGRSDVAVNMIRDAAPFSLTFFRQIIRNDLESPGQFENMRRWTRAPNFYINTLNPRTGRDILQRELDLIVNTIRHTVPQATGGTFEAGLIEVGSGDRPEQPNFIKVEITYEPNETYCGKAQIAANPGRIWFNYERCVNVCRGEAIGPNVVAHEVGHAMGLWHHDQRGIMDRFVTQANCGDRDFTSQERHHIALLYARQPGNADPDWDQPATLSSTSGGPGPVVTCFR